MALSDLEQTVDVTKTYRRQSRILCLTAVCILEMFCAADIRTLLFLRVAHSIRSTQTKLLSATITRGLMTYRVPD